MVALTDWPVTQQNNLPLNVAGNDYQPEAAKDTVLICKRNIISDFTFYDKANVITRIDPNSSEVFPFTFVENNREINASLQERLIKELKQGAALPEKTLQKDLITSPRKQLQFKFAFHINKIIIKLII